MAFAVDAMGNKLFSKLREEISSSLSSSSCDEVKALLAMMLNFAKLDGSTGLRSHKSESHGVPILGIRIEGNFEHDYLYVRKEPIGEASLLLVEATSTTTF